jgi:hypothetical protein
MKKNMFISFPRSGHCITIKIIQDIAEKYKLPFSYCEFYNHNTPSDIIGASYSNICTKPDCNNDQSSLITKSHDFALNYNCLINEWKQPISINSYQKYIVLYRDNAIIQLEAWYRHCKNSDNPDYTDYTDFPVFYKSNINYYKAFREKWVDTKYYNVLAISYETLVNNPTQVILSILRVIYPNTFNASSIDNLKNINDVIAENNLRYQHIMTKKEYYELENMIK